ncbi:predicted protein, partial [Nematostella vectensis]
CEHHTRTIQCPASKTIDVSYANYGRTAPGSEACPSASIQTTNCVSSSATITAACQGQNSCTLQAKNSVYGDPCVGTYKYIEIRYNCEGRSEHKIDIICERHNRTIQCPANKTIDLSYANYGRTAPGSEACPNASIKNTNCVSSSATITAACQGQNSCTLQAKNSVYGDPCVGTYKYIEIRYNCV